VPDVSLSFGLIGLILAVAALASRVADQWHVSIPLLFLVLGLLLGEPVFGVIELTPQDRLLEVVATLSLALVLFLDAVKLSIRELGKRWLVPFLILVPGTALIMAFGALPLGLMLGLSWTVAFIGGAAIASTDPVVLRDILRDPRVPRSVRQTLQIEAGLNDVVVLPVILILIAIAQNRLDGGGDWSIFLSKTLVMGPALGLAIGGVGSWLISKADARLSIRREYQALYGLGMVLAAYSAAAAAGGDGFLAAFAAGLGVVVFDQKLCDCFLEYGETTSEMAMLFAFLLFGAVLSGILGEVSVLEGTALAAIVIVAVRPAVLAAVLSRTKMSWAAKTFIVWFGPRGLSTLLLTLLAVQAGLPEGELLLAAVGFVVIASVALHGATAGPAATLYARKVAAETLEEERESTAAGLFAPGVEAVPRIKPEELYALLNQPSGPVVLDVRSRSSYERDEGQIPGSVRVEPDRVAEWAVGRSKDRLVVTYCA
jgi:NhaP-type Na+/H+ or K+/H+ antiporter